MKQSNVRSRLIEQTIAVIASEGLDKTTTKAIVKGTGINESYIYRYFYGKEDLLAKTFEELDNELVEEVTLNSAIMDEKTLDFEVRSRLLYHSVWRFLLGNREKCLAFVRYYYSPYFNKYSSDAHKARYSALVNFLSKKFRSEANVWMLLNHMLNVMLDFSVKVYSGAVPDNEDTEEHVFRLIWFSVKPYFKEEKNKEKKAV